MLKISENEGKSNLTVTQIVNKININSEFIKFYERQYSNPMRGFLIDEKKARRHELMCMLSEPRVWGQRCATCGTQDREAFSFRDKLSVDEFRISGMCQRCQDSVFKK